MSWAIETENLGMLFTTNWGSKKRALDHLSLQVAENEIFGFLGHNGAGKTTTIKILIGLCRASEGNARICGISIAQGQARQKVGFLPENISFHEYLTGLETIRFYADLHGLSPQDSKKRVPALLEEVGLKDAMHRRVREYSKGMRQRLGLAQAMVHDPQIFILDEPFTGLDPIGRREIREKICSLKEQGKTIFFSSHILSDVELLCDRVALLSQGKLIAIGKLGMLLDPKIVSVEVVGEGFTPEALTQIKSFCVRIVNEDKKSAVLVKTETEALQVKQLLEKSGGTLKSFIPQRESLEDFYMRQTSQGAALSI
jgi:ABC-2 type transport system ATP-binding protein